MEKVPNNTSRVTPDEYIPIRVVTNVEQNTSKILLGKFLNQPSSQRAPRPNKHRYTLTEKSSLLSRSISFSDKPKGIYQKLLIKDSYKLKKLWDVLLEFILIYNLITTLFFLAYSLPENAFLKVDIACWVLFIADIIVILMSERKNRHNFPIRTFTKIFKLYLKEWFIVDIISIIPLSFFDHPEAEYLLRMFRLLKLPSVLNFTDGVGLGYMLACFKFGKVDKNGKVRYSFRFRIFAGIAKLFTFILFVVYFLGCFWYWFQHKVAHSRYSSGTSNDDWSYEDYFGLEDLPLDQLALANSYFMLTTMVTIGYGDFLPKNIYEMSFLICTMLFGVTLFAYISGSVNSAIAFYSDLMAGRDFLGNLNIWLDSIEDLQGKIPTYLRQKVVEHFTYFNSKDRLRGLAKNYWEAESADDLISINQEYSELMPESLYYEVLNSLYSDMEEVFHDYFVEPKCFYSILPHLQPNFFPINTYVYLKNSSIQEVNFITQGKIAIGLQNDKNFEALIYVGPGDVIGDLQSLTSNDNTFDYFSISYVDSLMICSYVFKSIIVNFFKQCRGHMLGISGRREIELKKLKRINRDLYTKDNNDSTFIKEKKEQEVDDKELDRNMADVTEMIQFINQKMCVIDGKLEEIMNKTYLDKELI